VSLVASDLRGKSIVQVMPSPSWAPAWL
jgi:hypothetical protein